LQSLLASQIGKRQLFRQLNTYLYIHYAYWSCFFPSGGKIRQFWHGGSLGIGGEAPRDPAWFKDVNHFWPLLLNGTFQPVIDCHFPMLEAQAAHAYVAQNKNTGKVVLML